MKSGCATDPQICEKRKSLMNQAAQAIMAGARNKTGLLALVIVSVDKETKPLPSEVVPACRNRNIPK